MTRLPSPPGTPAPDPVRGPSGASSRPAAVPPAHGARRLEPERMDGPLPYSEAARALRDLDRVHRWTVGLLALRQTVVAPLVASRSPTGLSWLLDVGTGSGSGPASVARAARRRGVTVRAVGVDRRLAHLVAGREDGHDQLRVVASADALPFRDGAVDWATCHLFIHHFDEADTRRTVGEMRRCARVGVALVDLRRNRLAAWLIRLLFPLLGIGEIARTDGLLSVRQSWSVAEIRALARHAAWPVSQLRRRFPFRWSMLIWATDGQAPTGPMSALHPTSRAAGTNPNPSAARTPRTIARSTARAASTPTWLV